MGKFRVIISENAIRDIQKHLKSGNQASIKKIEKILKELETHPFTGTGKPERLKYKLRDKWSRRINQKDRMIYSVDEGIVRVEVLSAMGHYKDN